MQDILSMYSKPHRQYNGVSVDFFSFINVDKHRRGDIPAPLYYPSVNVRHSSRNVCFFLGFFLFICLGFMAYQPLYVI